MKIVIKIFSIFYFILFCNQSVLHAEDHYLEIANSLYDEGKFIESVYEASKSETLEAKIFCARTLATYGHFLLKGDEAIETFMKARTYAEEALEIDPYSDAAHVEAAHTMGRYSQLIGIVTALKEGFAERIEFHLDEAIKLNSENVNAQIAKGSWHAEIVDKAGFMANILYGATSDQARNHYEIALNLDGKNIGVLYEVSYGLFLLDAKEDIIKAKQLLLKAIESSPKNHLDKLYIKKSKELLKIL